MAWPSCPLLIARSSMPRCERLSALKKRIQALEETVAELERRLAGEDAPSAE